MKDVNFGAFESLYDFYTAFPNEETCIAYLEKVLWPNGVVSPYDVSSKVYKRGDGYYRCKISTFSVFFTCYCQLCIVHKILSFKSLYMDVITLRDFMSQFTDMQQTKWQMMEAGTDIAISLIGVLPIGATSQQIHENMWRAFIDSSPRYTEDK